MTLGSVIGIAAIGVVALIFIMFPEARALGKGFTRLFIKDLASTPEGAEAIYTEKIEELQNTYNKASDSYRMVAGEYEECKKNLENLQKKLPVVESQCENFIRNGKEEHAAIKAQERQEIIEDIERVGDMMDKYKAAMIEAKNITEICEQQLIAMKKEKRDVVQGMKDNIQISNVYKQMDHLKAETGADKMLAAAREKSEELNKIASGSKAVYQNSTAARIAAVNKDSRRMESSAYLDSLRAKYNTKSIGSNTNSGEFNKLASKDSIKVRR